MRKLLLFLVVLAAAMSCGSQQSCVVGNVDVYEGFESKYVEDRAVRVWTPQDYSSDVKYSVIYMHDGQNLFDASTTWNQQEWGVDEVLSELMASGEIGPCIVVGIDNSPSLRFEEYYPSSICADVPAGVLPEGFVPLGDQYLRFLVEEVKPFVDGRYSTWTDAEHTFVMGSSCGGLISSYAFCEYPEIFGGAACLSTHSTLRNPTTDQDQSPAADAYREYLRKRLPADGSHRLYMDCGDQTLDEAYAGTQAAINEMIGESGWEDGHFMYKFFPGHAHTENDWRARLDIPVKFLLGNLPR